MNPCNPFKFWLLITIFVPFFLVAQDTVSSSKLAEDSTAIARRKAYEATLKRFEKAHKMREKYPQRYADSISTVREERLHKRAQERIKEYVQRGVAALVEIDLTGARLKEVPDWIYNATDLEVLLLDNNQITRLPKELSNLKKLKRIYWRNNQLGDEKIKLPKLDGVEKIDLSGNGLSKLPGVHRLKNLKELILENNDFNKLPTWRGRRLKKLKELDISSNPLKLDKRWYGLLDHIEILKINKCELQGWDPAFYRMVGLRELQVQVNSIQVIPDGISNLSELSKLSFYKNNLSKIPIELFELNKLEVIDLYYNNLEKIPSQIGELERLKILYLSFNHLFDLPESIGDLSQLEELYIHHNRLSEIPASISQLGKLRVLHFQDNYIPSFPDSIGELNSLIDLDISDTEIKSIPSCLLKLQLKTFYWRNLEIDLNSHTNSKSRATLLSLQERGVNVVPPISKSVTSLD